MNKKRQFILISSLMFIILIVLMSVYLIFRVKKITVSYKYNSHEAELLSEQETQLIVDKIINESGFKKNELIFFSSKEKAKKNIEDNNKSVKVTRIEKRFPNIIAIEVYKKNGLYTIKSNNGKYSVLDEDFEYIKEVTSNNSYIDIEGVTLSEEEVKELSSTKYNGKYKKLVNTIKLLEEQFNFTTNDKSNKAIENREKHYNFIEKFSTDAKNENLILKTRSGLKIKYNLNINNLETLISNSISFCQDPMLQNYLINISNSKEKEISKQQYIIIFELKKVNDKYVAEPKLIEEKDDKH